MKTPVYKREYDGSEATWWQIVDRDGDQICLCSFDEEETANAIVEALNGYHGIAIANVPNVEIVMAKMGG